MFLRVWKHQCTTSESRVELLKKCGALKLQSMFKVSLPGELLSDILIALDSMPVTAEGMQVEKAFQGCADSQQVVAAADSTCSGDVELIFDIMKALSGEHAAVQTFALMEPSWSEKKCVSVSGTGRFALTVRLISLAAKQAVEGLFLKLRQVSSKVSDATKLDPLQSAFGIHHVPSK